jgi:hypothetical protein
VATPTRPRKSAPRKAAAKPDAKPNPISEVVPKGDHRDSLIAIRDRLASETDDLKWSKHRAECHCVCGMTDVRALVALAKKIEETLSAIAALPAPDRKESAVDRVVAGAAKRRDELAAKRANRASGASAS